MVSELFGCKADDMSGWACINGEAGIVINEPASFFSYQEHDIVFAIDEPLEEPIEGHLSGPST